MAHSAVDIRSFARTANAPRRKQRALLRLFQRRQRRLQLAVLARVPRHERRRPRPASVPQRRVGRRGSHRRVRRQAEVVVRREEPQGAPMIFTPPRRVVVAAASSSSSSSSVVRFPEVVLAAEPPAHRLRGHAHGHRRGGGGRGRVGGTRARRRRRFDRFGFGVERRDRPQGPRQPRRVQGGQRRSRPRVPRRDDAASARRRRRRRHRGGRRRRRTPRARDALCDLKTKNLFFFSRECRPRDTHTSRARVPTRAPRPSPTNECPPTHRPRRPSTSSIAR